MAIRDLRVACIIGTLPEERECKQDLLLNIVLHTDLQAAGASDAIEDTVDYAALAERVVAVVGASADRLLERVAERVASCCLADERVTRAEVRVDKHGAVAGARSVAVTIVRERAAGQQRLQQPRRNDHG